MFPKLIIRNQRPLTHGNTSISHAMLKQLKIEHRIILASKIMRNMKSNIFSNLKSKVGLESMVHATSLLSCNDCNFSYPISTTHHDLQRTLTQHRTNSNSTLNQHFNTFPQHTLADLPFKLSKFNSRRVTIGSMKGIDNEINSLLNKPLCDLKSAQESGINIQHQIMHDEEQCKLAKTEKRRDSPKQFRIERDAPTEDSNQHIQPMFQHFQSCPNIH